MMYSENVFLDRFEAAAKDDFKAVEFLFPYQYPVAELKARLDGNGLRQVLFNAPPGYWERGERGIACLPGRELEFQSGIAQAIDYAVALSCPRLHIMAGLVPAGLDRASVQPAYIANLQYAAIQAARAGLDVLIEPINSRNMPGYFLNRQDHAHELIAMIGAPNVLVQMDLYHCQVVEGDVALKIRQYLPTGRVGHFQVAGVPERFEPDVGELNYAYLFDVIDEVSNACGWQGWVGCEYNPRLGGQAGGTSAGLGWLRSRG
jgi:2-dehydrotetronate isomerase